MVQVPPLNSTRVAEAKQGFQFNLKKECPTLSSRRRVDPDPDPNHAEKLGYTRKYSTSKYS
jgi:hypothetical protein